MEQVQIGNKTLNLLELDELNEDSQEKENKRIFVSKFISIFCVFLIIFILIPKFLNYNFIFFNYLASWRMGDDRKQVYLVFKMFL